MIAPQRNDESFRLDALDRFAVFVKAFVRLVNGGCGGRLVFLDVLELLLVAGDTTMVGSTIALCELRQLVGLLPQAIAFRSLDRFATLAKHIACLP